MIKFKCSTMRYVQALGEELEKHLHGNRKYVLKWNFQSQFAHIVSFCSVFIAIFFSDVSLTENECSKNLLNWSISEGHFSATDKQTQDTHMPSRSNNDDAKRRRHCHPNPFS